MASVKSPYPFSPDAYASQQEPPPYSETAPEGTRYSSSVADSHDAPSVAYSQLPEVVRRLPDANQHTPSVANSQLPEAVRVQTHVDRHTPIPAFSQLPEATRTSSAVQSSTVPADPSAQSTRQSASIPESSSTPQSLQLFSDEKISSQTQPGCRLIKPIAIPATSPDIGSPFLRAWPTDLADFGISKEMFLSYLDELNRICVKSPPLAVLDLAGTIVGFVPLQTTQIVGGSINLASKLGTAALSKGRTELFLRDINAKVFSPRDLKVEIAKLEAVAKISGMPILEDGKVSKHASILRPLDDVEQPQSIGAQQRRLEALEPYIAHLDIAPLPEIVVPTNPLSQLSVKVSEKQRSKSEAKYLKERSKAAEKFEEESFKLQKDLNKEMRKLDEEEAKVQRKEGPKKLGRELEKIEKERAKVMHKYEKESGKLGKHNIKDDKEEKSIRKILFLVIRNIDADSGLDGGVNPYV